MQIEMKQSALFHKSSSRFFASCLLLLLSSMSFNFALGGENYVEMFLSSHDGQIGKNYYGEHFISAGFSAQLYHYEDDFYRSDYVGLARTFDALQLGLGMGEAEYDGLSFRAYNPWAWYKKNGWEAYAEYEFIPDDLPSYYYRAYLYKDLARHLFAGAYAERDVGVGPVIGLRFEHENSGLVLNLVKPVLDTPATDRVSLIAYVTAWLSF